MTTQNNVIKGAIATEIANLTADQKKFCYDQISNFLYGQNDIGWLSFYKFFREKCGLIKKTERLVGLLACAEETGWVLPYDSVCFVSCKPCAINLNEQGELHSSTEAAVTFMDGFKVYAINGISVPVNLIEDPGSISLEQIESEGNAEIRRLMINIYGENKYIASFKPVDEQVFRGRAIILYKKEFEDDETLAKVKVLDCSPDAQGIFNHYFVGVDPKYTDAIEALASTFNVSKKTYMTIAVET